MSFSSSFPGFKLRLTRWGAVFLLVSLVLGFAAVNTGNNALMATLGLALASYVVSGTWSREVLARVRATVEVPNEVFAGRTTVVEVDLENASRIFPAYGLVLRDSQGKSLLVETLLPAGATRRHSVEISFPSRGWVSLSGWRVDVLLPLGFFLKSKELLRNRRVLVFPTLLPATSVEARSGGRSRHAERWQARGREGEITQLREFRDGDELRQIHWKQTARQQRPITMDRERPAEAPVVFVVDPRVADLEDGAALARFERMLSEVTTAVVQHLERGAPVGVAMGGTVVGPLCHRRHLGVLLRPLAEAEAQPADAEIIAPQVAKGARAVHVTVRP
jgi:uncharacterized protein (DUF58 family)